VGYSEKVDAECPASPEYYNSALVVDGDGDTVGNYRKSFLHCTDETWARESSDGFFRGELPGLGNVGLGIVRPSSNPYKLEAPWDAFEFGIHILEAQTNVVILTMAWQAQQDPSLLSYNPKEPDVEILVYWVQRLEPIIRDRAGRHAPYRPRVQGRLLSLRLSSRPCRNRLDHHGHLGTPRHVLGF
ncbi:hypothetical protein C8A00DRAFT_19439, partial [Chaetomidium leptoderma]